MIQVAVLLADGFEEVEAMVPVDLLRRAGATVLLTSVDGKKTVTGAHGITVQADQSIDDVGLSSLKCVLLPGGGEGTERLRSSVKVHKLLQYCVGNGLFVGAICAAPSVLGGMGLLNGRCYACYPGFEPYMPEGLRTGKKVERDDIFITAEGMGVSFEFGFALVEALFGSTRAEELKRQTRYE